MCFFIFLHFSLSSTICPKGTRYISGETTTVEVEAENWFYFLVNLFEANYPVDITVSTNSTAWLFRGNGLKCPNMKFLPQILSYRKIRTWKKTKIRSVSSRKPMDILSYGIYARNNTKLKITVTEQYKPGIGYKPIFVIATFSIISVLLIASKYILDRAAKSASTI